MNNNVEGIALVGLVSRWRGTIKVVYTQERGNKPYRQVVDKLWFKRLDGTVGDSATDTQLSDVQGIATTFATVHLVDSHRMKAG